MSTLKTQLKELFQTSNPSNASTTSTGAVEVTAGSPPLKQETENYLPILAIVGTGILVMWAMVKSRRSAADASLIQLAALQREAEEESGQDYADNW